MGFNHVLTYFFKFSKYSSCMSKLIITKHCPCAYVFFYTCFTNGYTQAQYISTLKTRCVGKVKYDPMIWLMTDQINKRS